MPTRHQAIIWINVDPIHWRLYVALGGDESTDSFELRLNLYMTDFQLIDNQLTSAFLPFYMISSKLVWHQLNVMIILIYWRMMLYGNASRIVLLHREFTGGFLSQRVSNVELNTFLSCQLEESVEQTVKLSVIWYATTHMWRDSSVKLY